MTGSASSPHRPGAPVVAVVAEAGWATLQDLGRPGLGHVGISANGAGDAHAAQVANILVGNPEEAVVIEVVRARFALTARHPMLVSVTGAAEEVRIGDTAFPSWEPLVLHPGDRLTIPALRHGMRTYLAVHGGFEAPRLLGSAAPDPLLGFGGRLAKDDPLRARSRIERLANPYLGVPLMRLEPPHAPPSSLITAEVTPGPEIDQFEDAMRLLGEADFEVSSQSDHMGLRLSGASLRRGEVGELLSRGVPVGAIQAPPAGDLILLLRARYVTAGYPVVAVVCSTSIDALAQAAPGDRVRLRAVTVEAGVAAALRRRASLDQLRARSRRVLASIGVTDASAGRAENR